MMPVESRRVTPADAQVELDNTIEAYTFLTTHLIRHFPKRVAHWHQRRVLRHALEHVTGIPMLNVFQRFLRTIR